MGGGVALELHPVLMSVIEQDEWSGSRSDRLNPVERGTRQTFSMQFGHGDEEKNLYPV
jgi:hypothetical protein